MKYHEWAESDLRPQGAWAGGPLRLSGQNGSGGLQRRPDLQPIRLGQPTWHGTCSSTAHRHQRRCGYRRQVLGWGAVRFGRRTPARYSACVGELGWGRDSSTRSVDGKAEKVAMWQSFVDDGLRTVSGGEPGESYRSTRRRGGEGQAKFEEDSHGGGAHRGGKTAVALRPIPMRYWGLRRCDVDKRLLWGTREASDALERSVRRGKGEATMTLSMAS
jgi:hypothetical protein